MATNFAELFKRIKQGTDAYGRASAMFGTQDAPAPEEPTFLEKLFQPDSPKVKAWRRSLLPVSSDTVTSTTPVDVPLKNMPTWAEPSGEFVNVNHALPPMPQEQPPGPESFLEGLARRGGEIAQGLTRNPATEQALKGVGIATQGVDRALNASIPVPKWVSSSGEMNLAENLNSPMGQAAQNALIAGSGPMGIFRNFESGVNQVKAGLRVAAKELPVMETGRLGAPAEIRKTLDTLKDTVKLKAAQEAGEKAGLDVEAVQGISPNEYWVSLTFKSGEAAKQSRFDWLTKILPQHNQDSAAAKQITDLIPFQSRTTPTQSFIPFKTIEDAQKFLETGDVSLVAKSLEFKGQPMLKKDIAAATKGLAASDKARAQFQPLRDKLAKKQTELKAIEDSIAAPGSTATYSATSAQRKKLNTQIANLQKELSESNVIAEPLGPITEGKPSPLDRVTAKVKESTPAQIARQKELADTIKAAKAIREMDSVPVPEGQPAYAEYMTQQQAMRAKLAKDFSPDAIKKARAYPEYADMEIGTVTPSTPAPVVASKAAKVIPDIPSPKAAVPQEALGKEAILAKSADVVPPGEPPKPPAGAVPPELPTATVQPMGTGGESIMGNLQNADELVTTMSHPDVYKKIANLPGIRNVMSYLNPSGVAKTVAEKGVVARAALREEGGNKAIGAFSRLEALGSRDKVWGKFTFDGYIQEGKTSGMSLDEVLTYRKKYDAYLTPEQRQWAQEYHNLEDAKLQLLRRNGIEINELAFEDGGEYVGRKVAGRINPKTGELEETAFIGSAGPGRPGAKLGAEKTRQFKDINEAIESGFRYLPPDEALFLNIRGAYNRIADKQITDWVLERIPWRTSASPLEISLARDVAKGKLATSLRLKGLLNRAVRGERVPVDASLTKSLPNETAELQALTKKFQTAAPQTADRVQALTAKLNEIVKENKQVYRETSIKLTKAHEQALKTHYDEATVQSPGFAGKILTGPEAKETAHVLNTSFSTQYGDFDRIINAVNKANSIGRYFMLAGDASPILIQLITFPVRFPKVWGKSVVGFTKALFSPEAQAAYLAKNNAIIQGSRNLILSKGGQTEFTEAFRSGGIMQSRFAKAPKAILEPFQRAFEGAMDTAGIELRKSFDHLATTPQRTAEVEQFINEIRGVTSSGRIGVSSSLRAGESAAYLAPRYNRAIAALLSDVARGGIRGDQARKAMAALIGGGVALATAISLSRGEGWDGIAQHLDIRDATNFLTWDVAGQRVGPGGKMRSLVTLLGKTIKQPERSAEYAFSFLRGNFAPVVGTGYDVLIGKDYIGDPTRPGTPIGQYNAKPVPFGTGMLALSKRVVMQNLTPLWLQSVALEGGNLEQRAISGGANFFGARSYLPSSSTSTFPSMPAAPKFTPNKSNPLAPKKKPLLKVK